MLIDSDSANYFLNYYKLTLKNCAGKNLSNISEYLSAKLLFQNSNNKDIYIPKDADIDFRNGIKKAIYDEFIFLNKTKLGYLIKARKSEKIYSIKGITTLLEEIVEEYSLIKTSILPFRGYLICDGLIENHNVFIGPNIKESIQQEVKEKQKSKEIIFEF